MIKNSVLKMFCVVTLFFGSCSKESVDMVSNFDNDGVCFYAKSGDTWNVVIPYRYIEYYDSSTCIFKFTNEAVNSINWEKLQSKLEVRVNGEFIYSINNSKDYISSLNNFYYGDFSLAKYGGIFYVNFSNIANYNPNQDPRNDPRIINVLKRDGKLKLETSQGASLRITQSLVLRTYSMRSCNLLGRPCQNSNDSGTSLKPPQ